jgi:hypothetical protein
MKTAVLLSLLCASLGAALPGEQDPVFIPGNFALFTTDELGNSYAISGDEVMLFDPRGRELARNSIKTLGRIHAIDAFYSLKPLLFSREQGMLAVLDNTLSVQATVDLSRGGYAQVTMACASGKWRSSGWTVSCASWRTRGGLTSCWVLPFAPPPCRSTTAAFM